MRNINSVCLSTQDLKWSQRTTCTNEAHPYKHDEDGGGIVEVSLSKATDARACEKFKNHGITHTLTADAHAQSAMGCIFSGP